MDVGETIRKLLEEPFWPHTLETKNIYRRFEDDSFGGSISVQFSQDGDG